MFFLIFLIEFRGFFWCYTHLHTHQTYVGVCISKESNSFVLDIPYLNLYLILRQKNEKVKAFFHFFLLCIKSNAKECDYCWNVEMVLKVYPYLKKYIIFPNHLHHHIYSFLVHYQMV